ncbi:MAG: hypothetical protein HOC23_22990 [Halieaceae bacterium]|nr:hypothetical protein [Halieaceae bacterium]
MDMRKPALCKCLVSSLFPVLLGSPTWADDSLDSKIAVSEMPAQPIVQSDAPIAVPEAPAQPIVQADTPIAIQDPVNERRTQRILDALSRIESNEGAYAGALPEQLLTLGLTLQQQNRHLEAIAAFNRGVHLARINDGLYSAAQIPMIQGEIISQLATGQFAEADLRQKYLFQVQQRNLSLGESRVQALMQQAHWQHNAFEIGLDEQRIGRLLSMWDLYRLALLDVMELEGDGSEKLIPPLYGLLRAQYLISSYAASGSAGKNSNSSFDNRVMLNRFDAYRGNSYAKGQALIRSIYDIERVQSVDQILPAVKTLVMLGDWMQWHGQRDKASEIYGNAIAELDGRDDAQLLIDGWFGQPVPLPDLEGLRVLYPAVAATEGEILLEFGVSARGNVTDLVRVDENEDNEVSVRRLMRKLRNIKFRPRFENGEPVSTDKIVKAYDLLQ